MTQAETGKRVGVSQSTISELAAGKAWPKRPPLMPAIAIERFWKQQRRTKRSRAALPVPPDAALPVPPDAALTPPHR